MGFLWLPVSNICASIIMLQKSSARKGFCAEGLRIWIVKWYIYNAGSVVFTMFPARVYFFEKSLRVPKICLTDYNSCPITL